MVILEIGVKRGGSLDLWKKYFNKEAKIYGIDICQNSLSVERLVDGVKIFVGNQEDEYFLQRVIE